MGNFASSRIPGHFSLVRAGALLKSPLFFALRFYVGRLFVTSGMQKVTNVAGTTAFFKQVGIPFPEAIAYYTGFVEVGAGLLLGAGLFSYIASFLLLTVMAGAIYHVHLYVAKARALHDRLFFPGSVGDVAQ